VLDDACSVVDDFFDFHNIEDGYSAGALIAADT
jgi:hypothetical protein